ncbi:MAG TPA: hypothetical protein VHW23_29690 [Kofleriaceae bacterium]|nr:hypothetical protein [Kofleriaceae bacterium]
MATEDVCNGGRIRCHAHIRVFGAERRRTASAINPAALPAGFGPADLQSAYGIDPTRLATAAVPVVAITDAFGYPKLEADLAVYRQTYGLPACTVASGCLKIVGVNAQGTQTTTLPPAPPAGDDWTVETALDVDMVSSACPLCKILVVQGSSDADTSLDAAQNLAASLGAAVISDSWGSAEQAGEATDLATADTMFYNHPGVAIFVASGDHGWDDTIQTAPKAGDPPLVTGPGYPATSAHTIAVGGTRLVKAAGTARGWTETAWAATANAGAGAGGSGCSLSIAKPAYQTASPCTTKANSDISAVADPATGVAVYNTNGTNGGWGIVGGTSAAAPFVAAIFAATGNGTQSSGKFIADNASKLFDVIGGTNGTCPTGQELLCTAKAGWDGPTGFGTPNVKLLMPAASGGGNGSGGGSGGGNGNGSGNGGGSSADGSGGSSDDSSDITGGCAAGGSGAGLLFGVALLGLRRRRR